jgi:Tfp pilus assembly protein PilF
MRPSIAITALCLAVTPCLAAAQTPYIPRRDDVVLQTVPSVKDPRVRAFETLRAALQRNPREMMRAVDLSKAYLDYGRDTGDARYLGRAAAVIAPWQDQSPAPIPALLINATILQSKHYFAQARLQLLDILKRDADNSQAWLTLATVAQVQGDMSTARSACAHLLGSSDPLIPGTCLSSLNAVNGRAADAYRVLTFLWPQARIEPPAVQSWIQGILADIAKYLDNDAAADRHFQLALQLAPGDNFLLADYADYLLDHGRARAALDLVKDYSQSDTSFLRQIYAETALGMPQASADAAEMARRFAALEIRGTRTYRREQAGFVLHIEHDPERALKLAQENWTVQRTPEDMRVLLETALAAGKPQAAQPVRELLAKTHLQDPIVVAFADRVRAALAAPHGATPAGAPGNQS